jgi:hypothetical protein
MLRSSKIYAEFPIYSEQIYARIVQLASASFQDYWRELIYFRKSKFSRSRTGS